MLFMCIGLIFLGAVFGYQEEIEQNPSTEPFYELPCLSYGGICVHTEECPKGYLAKHSGLCPVQQRLGVECCHALPISEKKCQKRGGECMSLDTKCPDELIYREANDCESDEKCCILVQ